MPESEAKVSIQDRGFKMGDAVFDNTRTFNSEIFKVRQRLDRLYRSCRCLRLDPGMSEDRMAELTHKVVEANLPLLEEGSDYRVIQRVTRGVDPPSHNPKDAGGATVIIQTDPIPFKQRANLYRGGIRVITPSVRRTPPSSISPRAKTHNYVNMVLLDVSGNLAEGAGSNIFLVKDGAIHTPIDRFTLEGISRQTVLDLAQELDIETVETDLDLFDAYNADEVFITSTSLCICPVSSVNGAQIADGRIPGPVTSRLERAYSRFVGVGIFDQYLSKL